MRHLEVVKKVRELGLEGREKEVVEEMIDEYCTIVMMALRAEKTIHDMVKAAEREGLWKIFHNWDEIWKTNS